MIGLKWDELLQLLDVTGAGFQPSTASVRTFSMTCSVVLNVQNLVMNLEVDSG